MFKLLLFLIFGKWSFHRHEWEDISSPKENKIIQKCKICGKVLVDQYECSHEWELISEPADRVLFKKCKRCGEIERAVFSCIHQWEKIKTIEISDPYGGITNIVTIKECIYCGVECHFWASAVKNASSVYRLE